MTLEQIRKMTDKQLNDEICTMRDVFDNYATDLNAAMKLVPQGDRDEYSGFDEALAKVIRVPYRECWFRWSSYVPNKPRALCEAFLLWKAGAA